MVNRKGFVYIMEIVLISVILIVSLTLLIRPLQVDEDWDMVELRRMGESTLEAVDKGYGMESIIKDDTFSLQEKVDEMVYLTGAGESIGYRIEIKGAYNDNATVGTSCTEIQELGDALGKTKINGRTFDFEESIEQMNWEEFGDDSDYRNGFDVILITDEDQVEEADEYIDGVVDFLENGGGIVQFSDIEQTEGYDIQDKVFDLSHGETVEGETVGFVNMEDPGTVNYGPSKIFHGVGSVADIDGTWKVQEMEYDIVGGDDNITVKNDTHKFCLECVEGDSFNLRDEYGWHPLPTDEYEFTVRSLDIPEDGQVTIDYLDGYRFNGESFGEGAPNGEPVLEESAMVANEPFGGRAIWLDSSQWEIGDAGEDIKSLVRASVIWASPTERKVTRGTEYPDADIADVTRFGTINKDLYETFKVSMNLWYLY